MEEFEAPAERPVPLQVSSVQAGRGWNEAERECDGVGEGGPFIIYAAGPALVSSVPGPKEPGLAPLLTHCTCRMSCVVGLSSLGRA